MPTARRQQIFPQITPFYHCISRCVRRAWLCGKDPLTGTSFDHRKQWIEDRLIFLSQTFAIDLAAYAVMSNHYHAVLHLNPARSRTWSTREVIERWGALCRLPSVASAYLEGEALSEQAFASLNEHVATWRERLTNLSWFMRFINEPVARMANQEDECTGRFWEGRFKSEALVDERAVLCGMAYVDLNPIRAGVAQRPEDSLHTSIRRRILKDRDELQPFVDTAPSTRREQAAPISRQEYLNLVDWSGRIIVAGKRGHIPEAEPPIVRRLGGARRWVVEITRRQRRGIFHGNAARLREICAAVGRSWIWGSGKSTGFSVA